MELGISTFGEVSPDHRAGKAVNAQLRVKQLMEEVKLADEVGLDVFAFGEHHREDFVISSPEILMAGAATITKKIKLSSSVTVLSSTDPVRTFQNFATVDLLSNGRAEIIAGRGSFIESFPLFGYDLEDYDELFIEKLNLFLQINKQEVVQWKGKHRAAIASRGVYPRPIQDSILVWIGVGGTPSSAARAGKLNLPMMVALLGGQPRQFLPIVDLFRKSAKDAGHDVNKLQLGISSQFFVAEKEADAVQGFYPSYEKLMTRVGRERGWSPMNKGHFEALRHSGPLVVGDVQHAIDKILQQHEIFNNTRFLAQLVTGEVEHTQVLKTIEVFGTHVAPAVRKAIQSTSNINLPASRTEF